MLLPTRSPPTLHSRAAKCCCDSEVRQWPCSLLQQTSAPHSPTPLQYCHDSESLVTTRLALQHYLRMEAAEVRRACASCCGPLLLLVLPPLPLPPHLCRAGMLAVLPLQPRAVSQPSLLPGAAPPPPRRSCPTGLSPPHHPLQVYRTYPSYLLPAPRTLACRLQFLADLGRCGLLVRSRSAAVRQWRQAAAGAAAGAVAGGAAAASGAAAARGRRGRQRGGGAAAPAAGQVAAGGEGQAAAGWEGGGAVPPFITLSHVVKQSVASFCRWGIHLHRATFLPFWLLCRAAGGRRLEQRGLGVG